jgi:2-polyprenyl-6-hydroxyphenyl methylase/3-demethylubiquinone-9 3-methyltransferase
MPPSAAQFHSQIASDFDALYASSPAFLERYKVWAALLDQFITPGSRVLDLGCGSGIFSFYLAKNKSCQVLGVDGAENMIGLCNQRRDTLGLNQARFLKADIPLSDNTLPERFDAVISSSVLEYIDDLPAVLRDIDARLGSGGVLILSFPNKSSVYRWMEKWSYRLLGKPAYYQYVRHVITPGELNHMLAAFGFQLKHTQYYAASGSIMRVLRALLPAKYATNLFVNVYAK